LLASLASRADDRDASASLQVGNGAGKLVALTAKEWGKLPRKKVEIKGKGVYEGVALAEVLRFAGASFEKHPRERAAAYVLVEGSDGYRAVLALAEVDPKVTDKIVLLADRLDGKALGDKVGLYRLIVPDDKVPARWVKQVCRVSIHRHSDGAAAKGSR
jgi:DMSO/TMAO reductase YedYZ molybdopterin-dependent catalytic subunit